MPRGGRRSGKQGKAYGNRTDLNKPTVAKYTGQQYGTAAAQARAQAAVAPGPPPTAPPPPAPPTSPPGGTGGNPQLPGGAPMPIPGQGGPLDAPSRRSGEPITAGLPTGPGVGPEALQEVGIGGDALELQLRALYQRYPYPEIAALLEED